MQTLKRVFTVEYDWPPFLIALVRLFPNLVSVQAA